MKCTHKHLLAAILTMALNVAFATMSNAQPSQVPVALRQDLGSAIGTVKVLGLHTVTVQADTANYITVVTSGTPQQVDSLRQPLQSMKLTGGVITVPSDFPYQSGIVIHTAAKRLSVESWDDSQVWLTAGTDTAVRLDFLKLTAMEHSTILAPVPVEADQVVLQASDFATLRYRKITSDELHTYAHRESCVQQMDSPDNEEAYPYRFSEALHMLFGGYSFGITGWSQAPFGGMTAPMGDYAMNVSPLRGFSVTFGYNIVRLRHWDFGIGFSSTSDIYQIPALMGTTVDAATGLTHMGPVDEPSYYSRPRFNGQSRVWRSTLGAAVISLPIRAEWHRRLDYRGIRISATVLPGISAHTDKAIIISEGTWTSGDEADKGRVDILTDTIGDLYNRFRCDLRFDIGWSHVSLYIQGSLTPLFRTVRKDDLPALDTRVYPMSIGFSFHY